MVERADMTSRILDIRSASLITDEDGGEAKPYENIQWISLLRSLSAYQMYRQEMGVRVQRSDVIEFMMHNDVFPRSIMFCLHEMKALIESLPNSEGLTKLIAETINDLKVKDVRSLKNGLLHQYIDDIQIKLASVHNELAELYFLKAPVLDIAG